ncbi:MULTISPECIES: hypothetical protein [Streptosporangium]|uniref:DUF2637 domain-containing protein n=1 Tax=Streptosporangium brasiliense TaxID=47480 RepID=A0ABT9R472_9ACTN|nr:hypothetical protein [Streptosporangium brasiliense]MDP9864029.1 hypothetical protein [Streptosporangium brasiliense]
MTITPRTVGRRDWVADLGIAVVALAALVSSASALAGLAKLAAWGDQLALLLPVMVDAYGITSTRIWLSKSTRSARVRKHAAGNATAAIVMSVVGNVVYHAIEAGALHLPAWVLVVAVSVVPPITIGLLSHLVALRSGDTVPAPAATEQESQPVRTEPLPRTEEVSPAVSAPALAVASDAPRAIASAPTESPRTEVVELASVRADRTAKQPATPYGRMDRGAFIAGLIAEIWQAEVEGRTWEPDYPVLEERSGYRRSWCEKAVREAREFAASDTPSPITAEALALVATGTAPADLTEPEARPLAVLSHGESAAGGEHR